MKKQFIILLLFATTLVFAQTPQLLNYQGIARNGNSVLAYTFVKLRFTIHDGTASGIIVYQETQAAIPTNAYGLFTAQIGSGTVNSGTFIAINWGTGAKYLQVEMDPSNGSAFTDLGTTQLLSVPYALQANKADTAKYAITSPLQPVTITAGPGVTVSGTYPNFTVTAKDTSATNELQTLSYDTATHSLTLANGNSISLNDLVPAGTIVAYGSETPPPGWLECNGNAVSVAAYPRLFAVIGSNFGSPSAGQFNLPDLRGHFVRGWNHNNNADPDTSSRVASRTGGLTRNHVGSFQKDAFQGHKHTWTTYDIFNQVGGVLGANMAQATGATTRSTSTVVTDGINNTPRTSSETRPSNVYAMYIIKY